jgi:hypothetical protein
MVGQSVVGVSTQTGLRGAELLVQLKRSTQSLVSRAILPTKYIQEAEFFLKSSKSPSWKTNFSPFMELDGLLPCSQEVPFLERRKQ